MEKMEKPAMGKEGGARAGATPAGMRPFADKKAFEPPPTLIPASKSKGARQAQKAADEYKELLVNLNSPMIGYEEFVKKDHPAAIGIQLKPIVSQIIVLKRDYNRGLLSEDAANILRSIGVEMAKTDPLEPWLRNFKWCFGYVLGNGEMPPLRPKDPDMRGKRHWLDANLRKFEKMDRGGHAVFGEKKRLNDYQFEKMKTLKALLDEKGLPAKKARKVDEPL